MTEVDKIIDVEKAIRSSKSKFVSSLPMFIIRGIMKLVCQDEMNAIIYKFRDNSGVPFVNDVLNEWNMNIVIKGEHNVPAKGRFVFVANHPLGGLDALAFLSTIYHFFPNVISPSNQLFNAIPNLKPAILGVNVFGSNTKKTVEKFNQLFESDSQIMIFPAGLVSRRKKNVILDSVWHKTFINKTVQFNRDIIPVHISGRNSNLFYFIANLRKLLRIKISIEIILLPREMLRQRNSTITLTIGEAIRSHAMKDGMSHSEWSRKVKAIVYSLPEMMRD
jgi:putative hemolysin